MKKKILSMFMMLCFILPCICMLSACDLSHHEHEYGEKWMSNSTHHWQVCKNCDNQIHKSEHEWDDGVVTTQPSPAGDGVRTFTCEVCGKTKTEAEPYVYVSVVNFAEWQSAVALQSKNKVSVIIRIGDNETTVTKDGSIVYVLENDAYGITTKEEFASNQTTNDYLYSNTQDGWVRQLTFVDAFETRLNKLNLSVFNFSDFEYDDASRTYKKGSLEVGDDVYTELEFTFVDKQVTSFTAKLNGVPVSYSVSYSNISLILPSSFTPIARTIVSESEWETALLIGDSNLTVDFIDGDVRKVAVRNNDVTKISVYEDEVLKTEEIYVKVGTLFYSYTKSGSEWMKAQINSTQYSAATNFLLPTEDYDANAYNAQTGCYEFDSYSGLTDVSIRFEDAKVVSFSGFGMNGATGVPFEFSFAYGIVTIEIPTEYVVTTVTESEFINATTSLDNYKVTWDYVGLEDNGVTIITGNKIYQIDSTKNFKETYLEKVNASTYYRYIQVNDKWIREDSTVDNWNNAVSVGTFPGVNYSDLRYSSEECAYIISEFSSATDVKLYFENGKLVKVTGNGTWGEQATQVQMRYIFEYSVDEIVLPTEYVVTTVTESEFNAAMNFASLNNYKVSWDYVEISDTGFVKVNGNKIHFTDPSFSVYTEVYLEKVNASTYYRYRQDDGVWIKEQVSEDVWNNAITIGTLPGLKYSDLDVVTLFDGGFAYAISEFGSATDVTLYFENGKLVKVTGNGTWGQPATQVEMHYNYEYSVDEIVLPTEYVVTTVTESEWETALLIGDGNITINLINGNVREVAVKNNGVTKMSVYEDEVLMAEEIFVKEGSLYYSYTKSGSKWVKEQITSAQYSAATNLLLPTEDYDASAYNAQTGCYEFDSYSALTDVSIRFEDAKVVRISGFGLNGAEGVPFEFSFVYSSATIEIPTEYVVTTVTEDEFNEAMNISALTKIKITLDRNSDGDSIVVVDGDKYYINNGERENYLHKVSDSEVHEYIYDGESWTKSSVAIDVWNNAIATLGTTGLNYEDLTYSSGDGAYCTDELGSVTDVKVYFEDCKLVKITMMSSQSGSEEEWVYNYEYTGFALTLPTVQ